MMHSSHTTYASHVTYAALLAACGLLLGCGLLQPNPTSPDVDVVTGGITNSIPVSTISGWASALAVITGHPELAGAAGSLVGGIFGVWAWWYRRKVTQLKMKNALKYRLGKRKPIFDKRTLKLTAALDEVLPPIPEAFDLDKDNPIPTPMFLNDVYGCCVVSAKAHMTRRLELIETGTLLDIPDDDIKRDYFRQTGGEDDGLVMLLSLQDWRKGWSVNGKTYTIDAFGMVQPNNRNAIRSGLYLLNCLNCGLELPDSAMDQIDRGDDWDVVPYSFWKPSSAKGSAGGHAVMLLPIVDERGLWCVSWGKKQFMTWAFLKKYASEVYGIIDSINKWTTKPGFDPEKLRRYLNALRKAA